MELHNLYVCKQTLRELTELAKWLKMYLPNHSVWVADQFQLYQ